MGTIRKHKHYDWHRLRRPEKEDSLRRSGLGTDLGEGLPHFNFDDWADRYRRWAVSTERLQNHLPGIFTTAKFLSLPRYLGGRREGNVREITFDPHNKFISASNTRWPKLAIKKFNKWALSRPEDQARTMHSLHLLVKHWIEQGEVDYRIKVPEVIAFKYPFLVMRSLSGEHYIREDHLPEEQRRLVRRELIKLGKLITSSKQRLIDRFKAGGLVEYPSPDFIPSNIITRVDDNWQVEEIWIIDQFSVPKGSTGEKKLQHGSMRRMLRRKA